MQDPTANNPTVQPLSTPSEPNVAADRPAFMTVEEISSPVSNTEPSVPPSNVIGDAPPPSFIASEPKNNNKKIAAFLGILALVGATVGGVLLAGRTSFNQASAWDCSKYNFAISREGSVTVINGSTRNEPPQKANIKINNTDVASFDVPALSPGQSNKLGDVSVPQNGAFTWEVIGSVDCRDGGSYSAQQSNAQCVSIKAFSNTWQPLSATDLTKLKNGDVVRFTVMGTTTNGTVDKARFNINGTQRAETNSKRPGTDEYFDEYTIPINTTNFNVTAQVHHQQTNSWY